MKKTAKARFAIKSWDEKPYGEGADQPKLTRASVAKTFTGDINGEGHVEYIMMYRSDGTASFGQSVREWSTRSSSVTSSGRAAREARY
jgi:hypothetical protein